MTWFESLVATVKISELQRIIDLYFRVRHDTTLVTVLLMDVIMMNIQCFPERQRLEVSYSTIQSKSKSLLRLHRWQGLLVYWDVSEAHTCFKQMFLQTPAALTLYIKYDISACVVKLDRGQNFQTVYQHYSFAVWMLHKCIHRWHWSLNGRPNLFRILADLSFSALLRVLDMFFNNLGTLFCIARAGFI